MNMTAIIGMLIGSTMIVYIFGPLFQFLMKKLVVSKNERTEKNISVVLSAVFCTIIYYLTTEGFSLYYTISALIIISLRDILKSKLPEGEADANKKA